jgi:hypothetical protein
VTDSLNSRGSYERGGLQPLRGETFNTTAICSADVHIQHGTWTHLGGHQFAWTFVEEVVAAMGKISQARSLPSDAEPCHAHQLSSRSRNRVRALRRLGSLRRYAEHVSFH